MVTWTKRQPPAELVNNGVVRAGDPIGR
jgi:hypothetical protein